VLKSNISGVDHVNRRSSVLSFRLTRHLLNMRIATSARIKSSNLDLLVVHQVHLPLNSRSYWQVLLLRKVPIMLVFLKAYIIAIIKINLVLVPRLVSFKPT
jgi:hypothetical protein